MAKAANTQKPDFGDLETKLYNTRHACAIASQLVGSALELSNGRTVQPGVFAFEFTAEEVDRIMFAVCQAEDAARAADKEFTRAFEARKASKIAA